MSLTVDQKVRMLIGELYIQIVALQTENEELKVKLEKALPSQLEESK